MRSGKRNHEEEECGDDEFASKREGPSSNTAIHGNNHNNSTANKDAKNGDRASALRSKHSVTEQRRRSKINERFQILRELIPHSDQKRDTASFLLEVIDYVQYLQEKVQKYEGSYSGWSPEPTKLIPWRNSHWRVQGFSNHPQAMNNGSGPGTPFAGKIEENIMTATATATIVPGVQNPVESEHVQDVGYRTGVDRQPESHGARSSESPAMSDVPCQTEDMIIEGGTINISSVYSHELLSSLTQALERAGIDLSQAKLSMQIDLGRRSDQGLTSRVPTSKVPLSNNTEGVAHPCAEEESDHSHKTMMS